MFTRFRAASGVHVMNAPFMHNLPANMRGFEFIQELGGVYEYEEEYVRSWLLRIAKELKTNLEQSDLHKERDVPEFLAALNPAIEFLESIPGEFVTMYSYDRAPSISEILTASSMGSGGIDDWALEELYKKRDGGRSALLAFLKKEKRKDKVLQAIELLLILFKDQKTRDAVQRFINTCDDDIRQDAAECLAAVTTQLARSASREQNRQPGPD